MLKSGLNSYGCWIITRSGSVPLIDSKIYYSKETNNRNFYFHLNEHISLTNDSAINNSLGIGFERHLIFCIGNKIPFRTSLINEAFLILHNQSIAT